jgi:hypothetical protein
MRKTLHQGVANTYYGQWTTKNAPNYGRKSTSIDRNGAAAGGKFAAIAARQRDFLGNRDLARGKFSTPRKTNLARANIAASFKGPPVVLSEAKDLPPAPESLVVP